MKRFITIDFLRGMAILGVCFVHLFSDLYDQDTAFENLENLPLSLLIVLLSIIYLGVWGGMFVMISATGNMFSMYSSLEGGKRIRNVVVKQIVGGIILFGCSLLVEGVFQRYGYFGTLIPDWGPADPTKIIWHAYSMTPVHALSICMILNGIIQGFLSMNKGYLKYNRNIAIYLVIGIGVLLCTQYLWDLGKEWIPGYPNGSYPDELGLPGDYDVQMPLMGEPFYVYIQYLFVLVFIGSNTPVFPFFFSSILGNIIGLLILKNREQSNSDICKKGIIAGFGIIILGAVIGLIVGAGFGDFLPLTNSFSDITGISGGVKGLWWPWYAFQTGGPVMLIFLMLRLIEFRGKSERFARKTEFIRRFGIPAFTIYAFHRFIALIPVKLISWISGIDFMLDQKNLSFSFTIFNVIVAIIVINYLMKLWEKVDYIGSLEWGMGTIASLLMPKMPKSKANLDPNKTTSLKWYQYGKISADKLLYHVDWIDLTPEMTEEQQIVKEQNLAKKISLLGLLFFPLAVLGWRLAANLKESARTQRILKLSLISVSMGAIILIVLSFIPFGILGISL